MQNIEKKYLGKGGLDADSADFAVAPTDWVNAENVRTLTTDNGETEVVESIGSTILINNPYLPNRVIEPASVNIEIGSAEDEANGLFVYFIWDNNGDHCIFCFLSSTGLVYKCLLNADVTGGLNFDKNQLIHSAFIESGCVYWVNDSQNEPRRFDIKAAVNAYHPGTFPDTIAYTLPVSQSVISWIRREPGLPLQVNKVTQTSPPLTTNNIQNEAFLYLYQYQYRNFELSSVSDFSSLVNYNIAADTFNAVDINIPLGEKIDQDVLRINLIAYYFNGNQAFVIRVWDKNIPADAAAIVAHNAGTPLTYRHYNDTLGTAIDAATLNKQFDSVPIYARTSSPGKDRTFMANVTAGYNTPVTTSLTAVPNTANTGTLTGQWVTVTFFAPPFTPIGSHYFIYLTGYGYYDVSPQPTPPPFPGTEAFGSMTLVSVDNTGTFQTYINTLVSPPDTAVPFYNQGSLTITGGPPPPSAPGSRCFKTDATYLVSIQFEDWAGRRSGYLTNSTLLVTVADRIFAQAIFTVGIIWTLTNANALNEIPIWADRYSINISKCRRTRSFLQLRGTKGATYAQKDSSGNWTFSVSTTTLPINCAFDITALLGYNLGYVFDGGSGDIMKIWLNDGNPAHYLVIVAQVGNWLITEFALLGTLNSSTQFLFEIYTPYQPSQSEPQYQVANISHILNPGTNTRKYSVLSGQINGDVTLLSRFDGTNSYPAEAMSPNDKFYKMWNTDAGKPSFYDPIGQVVKTSFSSFSNTFIEGTQINGLSTYDALDTFSIFLECGPIRKLELTAKVANEQGSVMLAICERETVSVYLGETQQYGSAAQTTLTISTNVIGTINVLKGSFGTINPESVKQFRGLVFWVDVSNGKVIQYADNGLFPISNYKMTRFWKQFCQTYSSLSQSDIEALGSRPFIFTTVDPHHWEILFSVPRVLQNPPKGYLLDYPSMVYPFDIWDGQAKAVIYKLIAEPNHWQGAYNIPAEGFVTLQNKTYAFSSANLYQMNDQNSFNNFFGVQYKSRIMVPANGLPNVPKVYNSVSVEGNLIPTLTYFLIENPYLQISDLVDFDWATKEGLYYGVLYRNKIIPTAQGYNLNGLLTSEKMRGIVLKTLYEFTVSGTPLQLRFLNFLWETSEGHKTVKIK